MTVENLNHTFPDDLDLILVPPNGAPPVLLMSDAGGGRDLEGVTLTFDDDAAGELPDDDQIISGTFRPTNYDLFFPDTFAEPAPAEPYATSLSALNGYGAIGTWRLFVMDNASGDLGEVTFGWRLNVETADCSPITVEPATLPDGRVGVPYSATLTATGGTPPYRFAPPGGGPDKQASTRAIELGNGLFLDEATGVISGVPVEEGPFGFTIDVVDATGCPGSQYYGVNFGASNLPPTARCKDVTIAAGANCTADASIDDGSTDPDGDPITLSRTPAGPYPLGATTVTLTVTDGHEATSQCTATITVVDQTAPTLTCPTNFSTTAPLGACSTGVTYSPPTVGDDCSATPAVSCVPDSGAVFPLGVTTVTCTATDDASNATVCSFNVTVDAMAPNPGGISGPANPLASDHGQGYTYAVMNAEAGVTYTWSVPSDAAILSGQGTSSIQVRFGLTSGDVSVVAATPCAAAAPVSLPVSVSGFDYEFTGSGTPAWWTQEVGMWQQSADAYENPAHVVSVTGGTLYESVSYGQIYSDFTYEAAIVTTRSAANEGASNTLWIRGTPQPYLSAFQRWNSGYAFNIAMTGRYSIFRYASSGNTSLQSWTTPVGTTIYTDGVTPNVLKVVASGETFEFHINGVLVKTLTGQTQFATGKVGIAMVRTSGSPNDVLRVPYAKLAVAGTSLPKIEGTRAGMGKDSGMPDGEESDGPPENPLFDTWGMWSKAPAPR